MQTPEIIVKLAYSEKDWTDYATLAANILGPIIAAFFGYWILRITKNIEHSQWRNQKLIEKRITVLDDISPRLNDILCYCIRVGAWKGISPKDVVAWKREVDKKIHISRPFFSPQFFSKFMEFMNTCYSTYQGHGVDAKLRTEATYHKSAHQNWNDEWSALYSDAVSSEREILAAYHSLQKQISIELNVKQ